MVNWGEISSLHVIGKLEEILNKWFGVELLFVDSHLNVQSSQGQQDYEFKNHFYKIQQREMNYGNEYLENDLEKLFDKLVNQNDTLVGELNSYFPFLKMMGCKIIIEGELVGLVIAYPFLSENIIDDEIFQLVKSIEEAGISKKEAEFAVDHLSKLGAKECEYLSELLELVSDEIITFHQEITKREEIIHDLNSELGEKYRYHSMIGKSKKMQKIYHLLERISLSESSVLIQGENGTGKELVAKAIHYYSPRKDNVFIPVNCSAFNDNLLDSELFGHVKGSFTGALRDKKGLFESAHGGTLFLDEIGDTSLTMQVKLLRVLQEGTYLPVGATQSRKADVRILAATNRNLKEMMMKGEFREDLFYRINVINVSIPSLKERIEDIPLLVEHFLLRKCDEAGLPLKVLSKKCMEKVLDYNWPGNVRELENEIERLVVLSSHEKTITPDYLSSIILDYIPEGQSRSQKSSREFSSTSLRGIDTTGKLRDALEELESLMISEGLKRCNFNKSKLAKELGISRAGLIMKVEKYGLDKRKKSANE